MREPDESQAFLIRGRVWTAGQAGLQAALAEVHESPERPRCLCRPGGVEMYVALHLRFVVKRMPATGCLHDPSCPSYEPEESQSGLGALVGDAVLEREPGRVELRVDFPWSRGRGGAGGRGSVDDSGSVQSPRHRMSLRAVLHFLFERAGFNRWTPAMAGRRSQGVLQRHLLEAAEEILVKGLPLASRLYVPEPFSETGKAEAARRRRDKLALLQPQNGRAPLALVVGEFKASEAALSGRRVWIKHMPDAPLLVEERLWRRLCRQHAALFEARDADLGHRPRLLMAALIKARREFTYEIDAAWLMLASEQWIPVDGIHELPLVDALVEEGRRFLKPLRYDAPASQAFANALLLDVEHGPVALHLRSPSNEARAAAARERCIAAAGSGAWVWSLERERPAFPPARPAFVQRHPVTASR